MASATEWVKRVEQLLREAEADGVRWSYEPDYCEMINCAGCCQSYGPLTAERGTFNPREPMDSEGNRAYEYAQVSIY